MCDGRLLTWASHDNKILATEVGCNVKSYVNLFAQILYYGGSLNRDTWHKMRNLWIFAKSIGYEALYIKCHKT